MQENGRKKWNKFFTRPLIFGIVLMLLSFVVSQLIESYNLDSMLYLISRLFETVGLALIISAVYDFSRNTQDFEDFTTDIIRKVIREKGFLSSLNKEEKKEDIIKILDIDNNGIHTDIKEFINDSVEDVLNIKNKLYRTNSFYNFEANQDENGNIIVTGTIKYTLHKNGRENYGNIRGAKTDKTHIIAENNSEINKTVFFSNPNKYGLCEVEIPIEFKDCEKIVVEHHIQENFDKTYGNFYILNLDPLYGLNFSLKCNEELIIEDAILFDDKDKYNSYDCKNVKALNVYRSGWIGENRGLSVLIKNNWGGTKK